MIKDRKLSFLILLLIYMLAVITCFFFTKLAGSEFCQILWLLDIAATIEVFIFSLIFRNASVYDPYWSVQPIIIIIAAACLHGINPFGAILLAAVCFWGLRLTSNWAYTFHGLCFQDWRYTMLKEKTGPFYPVINFVGIHMVPTVIVYLCIMPAVTAIHEGAAITPASICFVLLSVCAAILQGTADLQMHLFKKNGGMGFIRTGLWKHSRHPNYLGEILMWWGIDLACLFAMPGNWQFLIGAAANTCLFLFVSIPLAETHQARKPGFEEYKKQTRVLI